MASTLEILARTIANFETELVVMVVAFVAHRMLFGTRVPCRPKQSAGEALSKGAGAVKQPPATPRLPRAQMQALRAAVASSDLEAAMTHLGAVSAGAAEGPLSHTLETLLKRLLRLALERAQAPGALRELGRRGLLNARLVDGLIADAVQSGAAAIGAEVIGLAKATGLEPTSHTYCALLKGLGAEGRLEDAHRVFEQCSAKGTYVLNVFLDVCVTCGDMPAAERVYAQAQGDQMADASSHNTIMKGYLKNGEFARARAVMDSMRAPHVITFNALIDATLRINREDAWALIDEMQARGVEPNQVTCSILLRSIEGPSRASDHEIERILAILGQSSESMDELLIAAVCEACMRANRADLLRAQLQKMGSLRDVKMTGSHAFSCVIRAHGFVGDLEGTRTRWREMRTRGTRPTSITASVMVEALVANAGPEAGHAFIREMLGDTDLRDLVNAVIYNSVLKGWANQKCFNEVWAVYQEMLNAQIVFSVVTYNTIFDVCAKCRELDRIPSLLAEMSHQRIEPNLITYSTILKAYVQGNQLHNAFELLNRMKLTKDLRPDEVAYNTVLDGCARYALFDSGMALLQDMEDAGLKPSNFTLSLLVKLASRSRRLDQAFELCEEVSRKHRIRPNIHVLNNLMQACANHRDNERALKVLQRAAQERVCPDARTYSVLLGGCTTAGDTARVADLLRAAHGLPSSVAAASGADAAALQVRGGLPFEPLAEAFAALRGGGEAAALELLRELRGLPGSRVDRQALARLATKLVR